MAFHQRQHPQHLHAPLPPPCVRVVVPCPYVGAQPLASETVRFPHGCPNPTHLPYPIACSNYARLVDVFIVGMLLLPQWGVGPYMKTIRSRIKKNKKTEFNIHCVVSDYIVQIPEQFVSDNLKQYNTHKKNSIK